MAWAHRSGHADDPPGQSAGDAHRGGPGHTAVATLTTHQVRAPETRTVVAGTLHWPISGAISIDKWRVICPTLNMT
jgi:hypothetical protein